MKGLGEVTNSPSTHRAKEKGNKRDESSYSGFRGLVASLRALGVSSLGSSLSVLVVSSFIAGLAQAGILVTLGELAVAGAQGTKRLHLHGYSLSIREAVVLCAVLLVLFGVRAWRLRWQAVGWRVEQ